MQGDDIDEYGGRCNDDDEHFDEIKVLGHSYLSYDNIIFLSYRKAFVLGNF